MNLFSKCLNKPEKLFRTLNELKGKRHVTKGPQKESGNSDSSSTVFGDMFNRKKVDFATTHDGPFRQQLNQCIKQFDDNDDNMFAYRTNLTDFSITVLKLQNNKLFGIGGVSVEVLKNGLTVIIWFQFI